MLRHEAIYYSLLFLLERAVETSSRAQSVGRSEAIICSGRILHNWEPHRYEESRLALSCLRLSSLIILLFSAVQPLAAKIRSQNSSGPSVVLSEPDGGLNDPYRGAFPSSRSFVPVGVWYEGVYSDHEVKIDKQAGLNTYVALTNTSDLSVVAAGGFRVLGQQEYWRNVPDVTGTLTGYVLWDEIDMQRSPKDARVQLQELIAALPRDARHRYNNYGKGVMFWWNDRDAAQIVNTYQHTVSADNYWFTDPYICGPSEGGAILFGGDGPLSADECRRASNYGETVLRMRRLAGYDQPIWNFIEVGGPWKESRESCVGVQGMCTEYIRPREISAAVIHSYLAGARGVVYFNHTFGGDAQTQHALREPYYAPQRSEVVRTNHLISEIAPWINGWFADFNGDAPGSLNVGGSVTASGRWDGKNFLLITGHSGGRMAGETQASFELPCVGNAVAVVLGEGRTIPILNGSFSDTFADGLTTHIYRIDGGSTCGLRPDGHG